MKNKLYFLCTGLMFISIFNSCSDDMEGVKPTSGSEIGFSIVDSRSRTEYDPNNEFQINWSAGDKVRIYCEEAEDIKSADYEVIINGTEKNKGNLKYLENGLKWGSEEKHTFYAIYPADDSKLIKKTSDGILTFNLNKNQYCTFEQDDNGNYISTPDMTNAYMIAELSTNPVENVQLSFKPLMTTLQITVRGKNDVNASTIALTGLNIINNNVKDKSAYQGHFKYDLVNKKLINDLSTPFTQTIFVGIKMFVDKEGKTIEQNYIDLAGGKSATFTVFLPPMMIDSNNQLTVRPSVAGDAELDVVIGGNDLGNGQVLTYPASSKGKLTLPEWPSDITGNNWITPLDGNIYVQQLSIPGTHDAGASTTNIADAGRTQSLNIEEQWNIGIRAFDIRTAFRKMTNSFWVFHGATITDYSLEQILTEITDKLIENPKEFAILQIRHEDEDVLGIVKDPSRWNDIYDILFSRLATANKLVKWKPDLTIDECRGKIILLTRNDYNNRSYAGLITNWPDNTYGEAQITNDEGLNTNYLVQDYYKYTDDGSEKKTYFENLLKITNEFNKSDSQYFIKKMWALNHVSAYEGLLGGTNQYMQNAQNVVPHIYNMIEKSIGPSGIVFMDYAGEREAPSWWEFRTFTMYGDLLPQSVINNNYRYYMLRKMN